MRTDWPSPHNGRVNTGIQRTSSINDAEGEKGVLHVVLLVLIRVVFHVIRK